MLGVLGCKTCKLQRQAPAGTSMQLQSQSSPLDTSPKSRPASLAFVSLSRGSEVRRKQKARHELELEMNPPLPPDVSIPAQAVETEQKEEGG